MLYRIQRNDTGYSGKYQGDIGLRLVEEQEGTCGGNTEEGYKGFVPGLKTPRTNTGRCPLSLEEGTKFLARTQQT